MKRYIYILTFAALTASLCSCSNEVEGIDDATIVTTTDEITVAPFPGYADGQTRANLEGRNDKTSWDSNDVIYIRLNGEGKWYTLTFDETNNKWIKPNGMPSLYRDDTYEAVYAQNYEPDSEEETLVMKEGAKAGTAEYLTCSGKKPIAITFDERPYSRLRIYCGDHNYEVNINLHNYNVGGIQFAGSDEKSYEDEFTLTPDKYGNIYIYCKWPENTRISVSTDDMNTMANGWGHVGIGIGSLNEYSTITVASADNKSYFIDNTWVVANLTFGQYGNSDWSKYTDAGYTKVKLIGPWGERQNTTFNSSKITEVDLSEVTWVEDSNLPNEFCYYCYYLCEVKLPKDLKVIPSSGFIGCTDLKGIDIPSGVTSINESAFQYCNKLSGIELPQNLETIGGRCFLDCLKLKKVVCNATTPPALGEYAFNGTPNEKILYVPDEAVNTYKANSNWSGYFSNIKPISEMPKDE